MKFQKDREKFLVEAMGLEFRQCTDTYCFTGGAGMMTEGDYQLRLWRWASVQKWWPLLKRDVIGKEGDGAEGPLFYGIDEWYVLDPENLANAIYAHLTMKGEV